MRAPGRVTPRWTLDEKEFTEEAGGFVNQLLTFVTVMLLLAVIIALLGIVNTLALSVYERTRELGLLRAVGMTRTQVRAMVRWESVVISVIGAVLGAGLGIGLGVSLAKALAGEGIDQIAVPGGQLSGPLRAALDDQDAVSAAGLPHEPGEQRLADLAAADDGQSRAPCGDHARDRSARPGGSWTAGVAAAPCPGS